MTRKRIIILAVLVILLGVVFGIYQFCYMQEELPEQCGEKEEVVSKTKPEEKSDNLQELQSKREHEKNEEKGMEEEIERDEDESWVVLGDAFSPFTYDIDEDGKEDKIEILCEVSEFDTIEKLTLQVGELEKSIEVDRGDEGFKYKDLKCYILHIGEKRNLIYTYFSYAG